MNRFTKDMATIDDMLPLVLFDLVQVSNQLHQQKNLHLVLKLLIGSA